MAEKKKTVRKPKTKKIRILLPVAGAFRLPYNVNEEVDVPCALADALVEDKYAEFVK